MTLQRSPRHVTIWLRSRDNVVTMREAKSKRQEPLQLMTSTKQVCFRKESPASVANRASYPNPPTSTCFLIGTRMFSYLPANVFRYASIYFPTHAQKFLLPTVLWVLRPTTVGSKSYPHKSENIPVRMGKHALAKNKSLQRKCFSVRIGIVPCWKKFT